MKLNGLFAFTMAEILLSLTIIGVVAAITLPSLMGNINERTWNTQRKALHARMSQAIAMMPQVAGYGTYTLDADSNVTADTAAEAFLTEGLSKVLKINNICDASHFEDCGVASTLTTYDSSKTWSSAPKLSDLNSMFTGSYTDLAGNVYQNPQKSINTSAAAFETQNGESILMFYNPYCTADVEGTETHYALPKMCANFIYDLNGNKGPNTIGKDIGFITAIYSDMTNVVAPIALTTNASDSATSLVASGLCTAQDADSRLPNRDELLALFINRDFVGMPTGDFWSGTTQVVAGGEVKAWDQNFGTARRYPIPRTASVGVRCIKR